MPQNIMAAQYDGNIGRIAHQSFHQRTRGNTAIIIVAADITMPFRAIDIIIHGHDENTRSDHFINLRCNAGLINGIDDQRIDIPLDLLEQCQLLFRIIAFHRKILNLQTIYRIFFSRIIHSTKHFIEKGIAFRRYNHANNRPLFPRSQSLAGRIGFIAKLPGNLPDIFSCFHIHSPAPVQSPVHCST